MNESKGAIKTNLENIMSARENRAADQKNLISKHTQPLISFMLNIPGEYKVYDLSKLAFNEGIYAIEHHLKRCGISIVEKIEKHLDTGYEGFFVVHTSTEKIKKQMILIEEYHPLGRFFDIDVISAENNIIKSADFGRSPRKCYLCEENVWECAPKRKHTASELAKFVYNNFKNYFINKNAEMIASNVVKALNYEVIISPKPGLVDRENNGAHKDMDIFTFINSSSFLYPYFTACYKKGAFFTGKPENILQELRYAGMMAEEQMFEQTKGVNAHKGAIFSFGIVCAAFGYASQNEIKTPSSISKLCATISHDIMKELEKADFGTNGEKAFVKHNTSGARGEATSGFKNAFMCYNSIDHHVKSGLSLEQGTIVALLELLSSVDDTNMIARGGKAELEYYKKRINIAIKTTLPKDLIEYAKKLDNEFIEKNLSPGGCADILALGLFLYFMFTYN